MKTLLLLVVPFLMLACGASPQTDHAPLAGEPTDVDSTTPSEQPTVKTEPSCKAGEAGCDCDDVGAKMDCHTAPVTVNGRVSCLSGVSVCGDDGKWTACTSEAALAND